MSTALLSLPWAPVGRQSQDSSPTCTIQMLLDLDPQLFSLWASVYPPLKRGLHLALS